MLHFFQWFGATSLGLYMRKSTWGFAITETIHLLGLAVLGGVIILLGLNAVGWGLGRDRFPRLVRALTPVFWISLAAMVISGCLLVSSKPVRYYLDNIWRLKMLLLALAVAAFVVLRRRWLRDDLRGQPLWINVSSAGLFVALWLGVALAGRFIGFL